MFNVQKHILIFSVLILLFAVVPMEFNMYTKKMNEPGSGRSIIQKCGISMTADGEDVNLQN